MRFSGRWAIRYFLNVLEFLYNLHHGSFLSKGIRAAAAASGCSATIYACIPTSSLLMMTLSLELLLMLMLMLMRRAAWSHIPVLLLLLHMSVKLLYIAIPGSCS